MKLKFIENKYLIKFIVILLIFFFSLVLRIWNINQMGRTWDEAAYVEVGNKFVKLIEKKDFLNNFFYEWTDEPPLARYIYGVFSTFDEKKSNGESTFDYDYTFARISSSLISSLSVVVVTLIGWEFISSKVGVYAGIILSMLPVFVGFSQIATLESVLFFTFTSSVYSFIKFLQKRTFKTAIIAGFFLGLAILAKFTNGLLIPLFILVFISWKLILKYEWNIKDLLKKTFVFTLSSLVVFFTFWPMSLFNLHRVIQYNYELRTALGKTPSIEVFFGKLIHVPIFYFFVFFLITTPLLILILFFIGSHSISKFSQTVKKSSRDKDKQLKWIFYSLIIWFCFPFIQSFYNFRHHGIRFIIEIYAPLALIAGIGFEHLSSKITKKELYKFALFLPIVLYLFFLLFKITPYYLDYFNEAVGGTKSVYEKGLFQIGWWGQGIREAGYYIKENAPKGSTVGLAVSPIHVFPPIKGYKISVFSEKEDYDYVIVSYFHVLREKFDDSKIRVNYKLIYTVKADGAGLVFIYKNSNTFK